MDELRKASRFTKRNLIMLLYKVKGNQEVGYSVMHKCAKEFQHMLETDYKLTLGYEFKDVSVSGVWDNQFQKDIERYDAVSNILKNDDIRINNTRVFSHKLDVKNPDADFLLKTIGKKDIERVLNDKMENVSKKILATCQTQ